ncbi:MAG: hypothetical protein EAZ40_02340 [Rhodobacterales bacterium]|nr:MAG: hypothetical protein EAZ40_02340 [Rhodobacterales bacterium]
MLRVLVLCLLPLPALAQEADVLATYSANSGSLPPEYAWETTVTIYADGRLSLRRCTGYETEGPACKDRKAKVTPEALDAIRVAALASGLAETPAKPSDYPMVGGSVVFATVTLDGVTVTLPSDVAESDEPRVAKVRRAVQAAIPARLNRFLTD